jgi:hypothetical protein
VQRRGEKPQGTRGSASNRVVVLEGVVKKFFLRYCDLHDVSRNLGQQETILRTRREKCTPEDCLPGCHAVHDFGSSSETIRDVASERRPADQEVQNRPNTPYGHLKVPFHPGVVSRNRDSWEGKTSRSGPSLSTAPIWTRQPRPFGLEGVSFASDTNQEDGSGTSWGANADAAPSL